MKTASSRKLFEYWNERRGSRSAPERGEIDPSAIRQVLADSFVLATEGSDHVFRVAGTRVCALFGRELKGESFGPMWDTANRRIIGELLAIVSEEAAPLVAGVRGQVADGPATDLELLLLPLYNVGRRNVRLLGALSPVVVPYWLGFGAIEQLALATFRHLAVGTSRPAPPSSSRRALRVIDGGRV